MENDKYVGIVEDPRTEEQKALDYKQEDLASGIQAFEWKEKSEDKWKKFLIRNQDGSSACVAFATSKILGMHEVQEGRFFRDLSPKFIYTRRQNYPDGGMWLPNALAIACGSGACKENLLPCDDKRESFMNDKGQETSAAQEDAKFYKGKFYFSIKVNIDEIAKIIEQGYGVLLGFRFDYNEWIETPFIDPNSKLSCGHGVPAVDYMLRDNKKVLLIEDSWGPGFGKGGRRFITEEFLKERCFYAGYVTSLPNFIFTKTLRKGSRGLDVKKLQEKLKVKVDGIFGEKTEERVKVFQFAHNLKVDGIVGPKTNEVLNSIP